MPPDGDTRVPLGQIVLERTRIAVNMPIGVDKLEAAIRPADVLDDAFEGAMLELRAYVMTELLPSQAIQETVHVDYRVPASWWQHWKADHAEAWWYPRWAWRRWPARNHEYRQELLVTVQVLSRWVYPEMPRRPPERFGRHVVIHTETDQWWRREGPPTCDTP